MKKKWLLFLPLFSILAMSILLLLGLQQDPKKLAQALIGKTVPEFHQQNLLKTEQVLSNLDFPKQFFLLNVWGSWCIYCKQEHPFLIRLAKQGIPIVGLNYRDNPQSAVKMLQEMGNPFHFVINDSQGQLATKLAVEGAPETYLVDAQGIIRYHYSGLLNEKVWQQQFMPLLKQEKGVQE